MATRSCKDLKVKVKEMKIPHLTNKNKKKLETWDLGGIFAADWSQAHEELMKELSGYSEQKVILPKYEYHGKPEAWTSKVWREVYNLPKASLRGYVIKGKVQFMELQLLNLVKENKQMSKSGVLLEQVEENSDFILTLPCSPIPSLPQVASREDGGEDEAKKRKACEQAVSDSEAEMEEEEKMKDESPNVT
ncbi:hypothetical protein R1flu_017077 [Riccia fluitans]|uniref:Uncharacterized protein n=1 Tax=Riccia fluitans TaxID=41844 RepID=A0ABD1YP66_9MARC